MSEAEKFVLEMSAEEAAASQPSPAYASSELQAQLQQLKHQVCCGCC